MIISDRITWYRIRRLERDTDRRYQRLVSKGIPPSDPRYQRLNDRFLRRYTRLMGRIGSREDRP